MTSEYWQKILAAKGAIIGRRRLLKIGALTGAALATNSLAACFGGGGQKVEPSPGASPITAGSGLPTEGAVERQGSSTPLSEGARQVELVNSERAILDLGNMEVAVVGWGETLLTSEDINVQRKDAADYKVVLVQTIWRNKSDLFLPRRLADDSGDYYTFHVGEERKYWGTGRTFQYLDWGGAIKLPYVENGASQTIVFDFPVNIWEGEQAPYIPPGFGIPMGILADVPKNEQNYGFIVTPNQQGLANPSGITRGENGLIITDPEKFLRRGEIAENYPLIDPAIASKQVGEEAVLEDYMSVRLANVHEGVTALGKKTQNILFSITNISNDYLRNPGIKEIAVLVYLADGRVVANLEVNSLADDYPSSGETQGYDVMVGIEKPPGGLEAFGGGPFYQLYDLRGAKVLFMAYNRWGLWQLP